MVFADYALNHTDKMPEEVLAVAREILDAAGGTKPSDMSVRQAAAATVAYQGMTMAVYTITNNPYWSAACMVLADDDAREWGDPQNAAEKKTSYEAASIGTISMRDDWKTIYGEEIKKAAAGADHQHQALLPGTCYIQYTVVDMFMRKISMREIEVVWDGENLRLADGAEWEGTVRLN